MKNSEKIVEIRVGAAETAEDILGHLRGYLNCVRAVIAVAEETLPELEAALVVREEKSRRIKANCVPIQKNSKHKASGANRKVIA